MKKIISRKEAQLLGLKRYFTGSTCTNGHTEERITSNGACIRCSYERTAKYRAADPGKYRAMDAIYKSRNSSQIKQRRALYYRANACEIKAKKQEYKKANRALALGIDRKHYELNRDKILARKAVYRSKNSENVREAQRKWRKENALYWRSANALRRASLQMRVPSWFGELDTFAMSEAAELCRVRGAATGIEWHIDHMIPLRARHASGLHCAGNIQVIPATMNLMKKNRMILTHPDEWLGRLANASA